MANEHDIGPLTRALLNAGIANPRGGGLGGLGALASVVAEPPAPRQQRRGLLNYAANALDGFTSLPSLDEVRKLAAWNNTAGYPGRDPLEWRMDFYGNALRWSDHGDQSSPYGWQIDHIVPLAAGGQDIPSNLRALKCIVNETLGGLLSAKLRNVRR